MGNGNNRRGATADGDPQPFAVWRRSDRDAIGARGPPYFVELAFGGVGRGHHQERASVSHRPPRGSDADDGSTGSTGHAHET